MFFSLTQDKFLSHILNSLVPLHFHSWQIAAEFRFYDGIPSQT